MMEKLPHEKEAERLERALFLIALLVVAVLLIGTMCTTAEADDDDPIADAILWLVTPGEQTTYHGGRAAVDADYRRELSKAFVAAGTKFDLPVGLLVGMGYRESVFRIGEIGDGGKSIGIMQVGKQGRRACRSHCGDMDTPMEQIMCGSCWLDKGREWCGTLQGGVNAYACGECECKAVKAIRATKTRNKLADILADKFGI